VHADTGLTYKCSQPASNPLKAQGFSRSPSLTDSTFTYSILAMVASFLSVLLLAASVLARPSSKERLAARVAERTQSHPRQPIDALAAMTLTNGTAEQYSSNWAGGIYTYPHVRINIMLILR
jgi:hypothetical protein